MPRSRIHLGALLLEAFFVVLGVVLALGLNEYRGHLADRRRADYALRTIKLELLTNQPQLEGALAYHERARERLKNIIEADRRGDRAALDTLPSPFPNGIHTARMFDTAWQAAQETGALPLIPFDLTLALTRAYEPIDGYETLTRATLQSIMTAAFSSGFEDRRFLMAMQPVLGDFVPAESELLRAHAEALALLEDVPLPEGTEDPTAPPPTDEPLAGE